MTIEKICDLNATDLKSLIDSGELAKIAEEHGWLKITRPELAKKPVKSGPKNINSSRSTSFDEKRAKINRAKAIASQFGFDLGDI